MKHEIHSPDLTVGIKTEGAELCSMKTADGTEYLWQADPAIWGRHAPILFPVVGKLADNRYTSEGKEYELGQHGFARGMDFSTVAQTENSVTLELSASDETRRQYPFEFILRVHYLVTEMKLAVRYDVLNPNEKTMPFSIGAHPGFSLDWHEGDVIEDYYIELEKHETLSTHKLDADHLLAERTVPVLKNSNLIQLHEHIFDEDALILLEHESRKASLCSHKDDRRVIVEFPDFPHLGIWAKPAAPYVCIEPWFGYVDPAGTDGDITKKPGIILLPAREKSSFEHRITINTP